MKKLLLAAVFVGFSKVALALPALQLGPGDGDATGWVYDHTTDTWVVDTTTDNTFTLDAVANGTKAEGGNGAYAWEDTDTAQYAYLVVAALPMTDCTAGCFDIGVSLDGSALTLFDEGNGAPPVNDPNSLASHGIFDTYYQVYQFTFNGDLVDIMNTAPTDGCTAPDSSPDDCVAGTGKGYTETFQITINDLDPLLLGLEGIHFDLFTVSGDGMWNPTAPDDKKLVQSFAPFSHDAETGGCCTKVPEPGSLALLGIGLVGLGVARRRKLKV